MYKAMVYRRRMVVTVAPGALIRRPHSSLALTSGDSHTRVFALMTES